MIKGKKELEFDRNLPSRLCDNHCTDDGRTGNGRQKMDKSSYRGLCWHSQSELKICGTLIISQYGYKLTSHDCKEHEQPDKMGSGTHQKYYWKELIPIV